MPSVVRIHLRPLTTSIQLLHITTYKGASVRIRLFLHHAHHAVTSCTQCRDILDPLGSPSSPSRLSSHSSPSYPVVNRINPIYCTTKSAENTK